MDNVSGIAVTLRPEIKRPVQFYVTLNPVMVSVVGSIPTEAIFCSNVLNLLM